MKRRSDWGNTTPQIVQNMTSGRFGSDRDAKREKASITKVFHLIRKLDKHFGKESRVFYDKHAFKKLIEKNGIMIPKTYAILKKEKEWGKFWEELSHYETFVLKPNRLSEGRGIHVLTKKGDGWFELNGEAVAEATLQKDSIGFLRRKTTAHRDGQRVTNIMMAEERIYSHDDFKQFTIYDGIVDFRMYVFDNEVLYGKMRCPTKASKGLGNTSKNAKALFVRDGVISDGIDVFKNTTSRYGGNDLDGEKVPFWKEVKKCSEDVTKIFQSPFHSVDLTVDKDGNAVVMECEKIPTLGHFKKPEATRLHEILTKWAQEKLWKRD